MRSVPPKATGGLWLCEELPAIVCRKHCKRQTGCTCTLRLPWTRAADCSLLLNQPFRVMSVRYPMAPAVLSKSYDHFQASKSVLAVAGHRSRSQLTTEVARKDRT